MSRLAIFDIDATLVYPSTGIHLARGLRAEGIIGRLKLLQGALYLSLVRLRFIRYETLIRHGMGVVEDRLEEEVSGWFEKVYEDRVRASFVRSVTEKLFEHQARGDHVVLISATSSMLGNFIATALGVTRCACAEVEVRDGRIRNRVLQPVPYGEGKVAHAERFAEEAGLKLDDAFFYTDSISDLPLLERVGQPVVVNPDPFLRRVSLKRGWPIVVDVQTEDIHVLKEKFLGAS